MDDVLQRLCVRIRLDIKGAEKSLGSGVITKDADSFYVLTAHHCIYGDENQYSDTSEKEILVEHQNGNHHAPFNRIEVVKTIDSNEGQDWVLLQIEDPDIDIDFSKVINGIFSPDLLGSHAKFCGYQKVSHNSFSPFTSKLISKSLEEEVKEFRIQLNPPGFHQGSNSATENAKGLSGSGVYVEVGDTLYLIGIANSVIGDEAVNNFVNCCALICLNHKLKVPAKAISETHQWLIKYLKKVQDDFVEHMLPQETITDESTEKANIRYVELLVQERQQAKQPEKGEPFHKVRPVENGVSKEKVVPEIRKNPVPFSELIEQQNTRFLLFGDDGAGKSTSLRKLASDVASRVQLELSLPIPVFVELKNFDTTDKSYEYFLKMVSDAADLELHEFESIWPEGPRKFLFLLDGYNEVGDVFKDAFALALNRFMDKGKHYYLITSLPIVRAVELGKQLDHICVFDVLHLEENQIQDFLAGHDATGLYEQLGNQLKDLAQNPSILRALVERFGLSTEDKPPIYTSYIGQFWQDFIDHYIFAEREKKKKPSPTEYNYLLVKKPVLANLAKEMISKGVTTIKENPDLRKIIKNQLEKLKIYNDNELLLDFEPYEYMPSTNSPQRFLDEAVHNGIIHRLGGNLEFMKPSVSVRNYFAANAIAGIPYTHISTLPINEMVKLVPKLKSRYLYPDRDEHSLVFELPDMGNFTETLVMFASILEKPNDDFLLQLDSRNRLMAAKCACAAINVSEDTKRKLISSWQELLKKESLILKCLGCLCVGYSKFGGREVIEMLIDIVKNKNSPLVLVGKASEAIVKSINAIKDIPNKMISLIVEEAIKGEFKSWRNYNFKFILRDLNTKQIIGELFEFYTRPNQNESYYEEIEYQLYYLDEKILKNELRKLIQTNMLDVNNEKARIAEKLLSNYSPPDIETLAEKTRKWQRNRYEEALKKLKEADINELQEKLKNKGWEQPAAIKLIGKKQDANSLKLLLDFLPQIRNMDSYTYYNFVKVLNNLENKNDFLEYFKNNISNPEYFHLFDLDLDLSAPLIEDVGFNRLSPWATKVFKDNGIDINNADVFTFSKSHFYLEGSNELYELKKRSGSSFELYDLNRKLILISLAKFLGEEVIPYLEEFINEQENPRILHQTILSLSRFKGVDLIKHIDHIFDFSMELNIILECIKLLGESRSVRAILPLLKILQRGTSAAFDSIWNSAYYTIIWGGFVSKELRKIDDQAKVWLSLNNLLDTSKDEVKQNTLKVMAELVSDQQEFRQVLDEALKDKNSKIRVDILKSLNKLNYQAIEEPLLEMAVTIGVEEVRKEVVCMLRFREGDEILQFFLELLKGNENKKQRYAIFALGELKDETASEPLERLFQDTDNPTIKILTAEALYKIGNYESSTFLIDGLWPLIDKGKEENIIKEALNLLLKIPGGDKKLYSPIQDALNNARTNEDYKEVIRKVEDKIDFLPKDANFYWLRGKAYQGLEQFEEALSDYDQVELHSDNVKPDVYSNRAYVLDKLNRHEEALASARIAAESKPNKAKFQSNLGWHAFKAGQYEESVAASTKALELDAKAPAAAFNLGLVLLVLGQPSKAKDAYNRGIKICEAIDSKEIAHEKLSEALNDLDELTNSKPHLKAQINVCKDLIDVA